MYTLKMVITPHLCLSRRWARRCIEGASSTLSEDAVVMTEESELAYFYVKDKGNTLVKVSRAPGDL